MNAPTTARYDIQNVTVGMTGVHYGAVTPGYVELAVGPSAHDGHVLVTDGDDTWDVLAALLRRSR